MGHIQKKSNLYFLKQLNLVYFDRIEYLDLYVSRFYYAILIFIISIKFPPWANNRFQKINTTLSTYKTLNMFKYHRLLRKVFLAIINQICLNIMNIQKLKVQY